MKSTTRSQKTCKIEAIQCFVMRAVYTPSAEGWYLQLRDGVEEILNNFSVYTPSAEGWYLQLSICGRGEPSASSVYTQCRGLVSATVIRASELERYILVYTPSAEGWYLQLGSSRVGMTWSASVYTPSAEGWYLQHDRQRY